MTTRYIKHLYVLIPLLLLSFGAAAQRVDTIKEVKTDRIQIKTQPSPQTHPVGERKKVGVVLSGGGAKGVAHVRALKVIESAGIPIDYIAGTSMGAIVGGLYAIGYSTKALDSLVRAQDWMFLLSDRISRRNLSFSAKESKEKYILTVPLDIEKKLVLPSAILGGNNVYNLLKELTVGYHDSIPFKELPIPFACVAYDIVSGKAITLDEGVLALAIRASMSLPGAFAPIRTDSMVLIDGGISNNFPADVLKEMGAEIIIGIDVGAGARGIDDIHNISDMFNQMTYFSAEESFRNNRKLVDLYIHPDIKPYSAASFSSDAIDTLLNRGEEATLGAWDDLIALKSKIGIEQGYMPDYWDNLNVPSSNLFIGKVSFEGLVLQKEKNLLKIAGIKENTTTSYNDIQIAVSKLQGMGALSEVSARLEGSAPYNLVFSVKEASRNSISVGLRFDTEEKAAIMLNVSLALKNMPNSHFEITGRLSDNAYAKGEYIIGDETRRKLAISYRYKYNDLSLYHMGKKVTNIDFGNHTLDVNYTNIQLRNFKAGLGLRYDYYDYSSILTMAGHINTNEVLSEGIVSYYANIEFESLDRLYHPRKGIAFYAGYTLYTSNFVEYRGDRPFGALNANFYAPISISRRVCFIPGVFGRVLIGYNVAFPAMNVLGGTTAGRYMPQQMPFVGLQYFERFENTVIGAKLDFRVRLWVKNFVSFKMNYLKEDPDFFEIMQGKNVYGVGLEYSYNSIVGPLSLQVDYSNRDKKIGFYFNLGYYF